MTTTLIRDITRLMHEVTPGLIEQMSDYHYCSDITANGLMFKISTSCTGVSGSCSDRAKVSRGIETLFSYLSAETGAMISINSNLQAGAVRIPNPHVLFGIGGLPPEASYLAACHVAKCVGVWSQEMFFIATNPNQTTTLQRTLRNNNVSPIAYSNLQIGLDTVFEQTH